MSKKPYITLQPSEQSLVSAAATIYAAYITSGRVQEGNESEWIRRSITEAIRIVRISDDSVMADSEID